MQIYLIFHVKVQLRDARWLSLFSDAAWSRYSFSQNQRQMFQTSWHRTQCETKVHGGECFHTCMKTNREMPCASTQQGKGSIATHLPLPLWKKLTNVSNWCGLPVQGPQLILGFELYGRGTKAALADEKMRNAKFSCIVVTFISCKRKEVEEWCTRVLEAVLLQRNLLKTVYENLSLLK